LGSWGRISADGLEPLSESVPKAGWPISSATMVGGGRPGPLLLQWVGNRHVELTEIKNALMPGKPAATGLDIARNLEVRIFHKDKNS
jgi:hypothetical protein